MARQIIPAASQKALQASNSPAAAQSRAESVLDRLVKQGRMAYSDAERVYDEVEDTGDPLPLVLARLELLTSGEWADALADAHGLERVDRSSFPREPLLTDRIAPRFIRNSHALPIKIEDTTLHLAMADPGDEFTIRAYRIATALDIAPSVADFDELKQTYARYWDTGASALARIRDDIAIYDTEILDDPD